MKAPFGARFSTGQLLLCATVFAGAQGADAQQGGEIADLRRQIEALQQQVDAMEAAQQQANGSADAAAPEVATDRDGIRLTFSGRINASVLRAEQGGQDQTFIADNDASGSRFGINAETEIGGLTTGVDLVISAEVDSTDEIDFDSTVGPEDEDSALGDFRQAHWYLESERFGYVSVGQGDTAAEDTAHADLSGTDLAGAGSDVDDIAGGLVFRAEDGTDLAELDDFFDMQDGSRGTRVLYRSPSFAGLIFSASLANNEGDDGVEPAVAIGYERELGGAEVEAALSFRREEDDGDLDDPDDDSEDDIVVASASVLLASGLNFTLAASTADVDGQDEDPTALFAKVGYIADIVPIGETRVSLDYFSGETNADFAAPDGALPEATSVGLFAVQQLRDLNTELYVGYRRYEIDDVFVDGAEADVDSMDAFITGARVRF